MPFPVAAIVGGSIVSGLLGSRSAERAAEAQQAGSAAAIGEQRRQFDLTRSDLMPYLSAGTQALNDILFEFGYEPFRPTPNALISEGPTNAELGIPEELSIMGLRVPTPPQVVAAARRRFGAPPTGATSPQVPTGTPNVGFRPSPDFEFRRSEGLRNIGNSFAARGGALSGNALRALTEFSSNLASQEFGNWFNRRAALAGIGQTATNTGAQVGASTASNIGNALIGAGNARASGITGSASAINNAVQGGISNFLLSRLLQ